MNVLHVRLVDATVIVTTEMDDAMTAETTDRTTEGMTDGTTEGMTDGIVIKYSGAVWQPHRYWQISTTPDFNVESEN